MKKWLLVCLLMLVLAGCTNEPKTESIDTGGGTVPIANEQGTPSPSAEGGGLTEPDTASSDELEQEDDVLSEEELQQAASFGYADETGRLLLVEPDPTMEAVNPATITLAIGEGGQRLSVKHVGTQQRDDQDNGRQTANNLKHRAGELFEVEDGEAVPNATYLLLDGKALPQSAVLNVQPLTDQAAEQEKVQQIEAAKSRKVQQAWKLATIDEGQSLYLIQFEREQDSMLASLAIETNGQLMFMDYPATYDENSTWRVDDGGEVTPDMFSVLLAARTAEGMVIGIEWWGSEGQIVKFLSQRAGQITELELSSGRYMSPV